MADGLGYTAICDAAGIAVRVYDRPKGFYVYVLVDPKTDKPFYVGKGKGARALQHERALRVGGTNPHKLGKIAQIVQSGARPAIYIVADEMSEPDALKLERKFIHRAKDVLTNLSLGQLTKLERFVAESHMHRSKVIPLCHLINRGADREALKMWAWVVDSLAPFCNTAEMKARYGDI